MPICSLHWSGTVMTEENTIRDFLSYVAHHYKEDAPAIENRYHATRAAKKAEQELLIRQGFQTPESLNPIWLLKEIIVKHLSRPTVATQGPTTSLSKMDLSLAEERNVSFSTDAPTASSPEVSAFSALAADLRSEIRNLHGSVQAVQVAQQAQQVARNAPSMGKTRGNSGQSSVDISAFQAYQQGTNDALKAFQMQVSQQQQLPPPSQPQQISAPAAAPFNSSNMGPPFPNSISPLVKDLVVDPRFEVRYNQKGNLSYPSNCWERLGKFICFLCTGTDHIVRDCTVYPNEYPSPIQCGCLGFHVSSCKTNRTPTLAAIEHANKHLKQRAQGLGRQGNQGSQGIQGGQGNQNYGNYGNRPSNGNNEPWNNKPRGNSFGNRSRGGRSGYENRNNGGDRNPQAGNSQNKYVYIPVTGANATPLGQPQQGQNDTITQLGQAIAAQRAGSVLGNGGSQPVPSGVVMSSGQTSSSSN